MFELLASLVWQLIAAGMLLVGFGLGVLFGRARATWRLRAQLIEARDKAEWERARREQLSRQMEEIKSVAKDSRKEAAADEASTIAVLRGEVERLRQELRGTWQGQSEAQRRIQELEGRITILAGRQPRRTGTLGGDGEPLSEAEGSSPRAKQPGHDNILTLWNAGGEEGKK